MLSTKIHQRDLACKNSDLQMSSTSSTMERSVSRVGCDGGGEKVDEVPAAPGSSFDDEEEVAGISVQFMKLWICISHFNHLSFVLIIF